MLRVGLTGEMGSGKSTVARLLAKHGAHVFSSDEMARAMMQPGQPVYQAIVDHFGPHVLQANGQLDRTVLADLAFHPEHARVEELNALVHPAVIAAQERALAVLAREQPEAIAVVESALLLTTRHAPGHVPWWRRFDVVVLVVAPEAAKLRRFVERAAGGRPLTPQQTETLEAEARRRMATQQIPAEAAAQCFTLRNEGTPVELEAAVEALWTVLRQRVHPVHHDS